MGPLMSLWSNKRSLHYVLFTEHAWTEDIMNMDDILIRNLNNSESFAFVYILMAIQILDSNLVILIRFSFTSPFDLICMRFSNDIIVCKEAWMLERVHFKQFLKLD